jgi:hypothetical protein
MFLHGSGKRLLVQFYFPSLCVCVCVCVCATHHFANIASIADVYVQVSLKENGHHELEGKIVRA